MEFVNSNLKMKQSYPNGKGKSSGKNRGGGGKNGRPHPQYQLNQLQYEQFVNNAIAMGRGGHQKGDGLLGGYGQISTNNGILQALQSPSSNVPLMNSSANNLGSPFQDMTMKNRQVPKDKKIKNGAQSRNNVILNQVQETHEDMTKRLNNEALIRVDSSFKGLFGTASQVAVYDYDAVTKDWIDTKMAGPLFLYDRSQIPEYGLVVLNRKGLKNLIMFFDKQSQIIPSEPYLLFRRGPDEAIKCIWFYKESEFHEVLTLFRRMNVQFDQIDDTSSASNSSTHTALNNSSISVTSGAGPNLFDMLKQSQAKIDGSTTLPTFGTKSKVFTAEELEQQMIEDFNPPDRLAGALNNIGLGIDTLGGGGSLLQQLTTSQQITSGTVFGVRGPKNKSGDSDDSLPTRLNDASRSMRTVEQLEKDFTPEGSTKNDMSNELLATLGIKPLKDLPESSSEICTPQSPFLTPTSRSISDSERSQTQRKLTIDDLDGKLYEETDEDMVREVVENLADLTELLLLSENVAGQSEPQLVWRKRSNLQNRPSSALVQVQPRTNGVCSNTPNMHLKHSVINNRSTCSPAISPLTENQLLQAITYLLQTDSSFIGKIHEAYIKSLQQSWTTNRLG